jgi:hypothetical protein
MIPRSTTLIIARFVNGRDRNLDSREDSRCSTVARKLEIKFGHFRCPEGEPPLLLVLHRDAFWLLLMK